MRRTAVLGLSIFLGLFTALAVLISPTPLTFADDQVAEDVQQQHVVVHLSHFTDDLHRCFMAVKVANLMQERGAEVTIFVDLEGVRIAQRKEQLKYTWGDDSPTLAELYQEFAEGGGKVLVCSHCARSAHITDPGLKRNAEIGTPAMIGKLLIEAEKVIDY